MALMVLGVSLNFSLLSPVILAQQEEDDLHGQDTMPGSDLIENKSEASATGASTDLLDQLDRIEYHIPDPGLNRLMAEEALEQAEAQNDQARAAYLRRVLEHVETIHREKQVDLSLEETIRLALANSYAIEVLRYNPAVETTKVVEAEAAFDAIFFGNAVKNNVDRPSGSQLASTDVDITNANVGISKLLPVGTTVSATYGFQRQDTTLAFQQINPEYFNNFAIEFRQPLFRGFGVDYNRSLIVIAQNDRSISRYAFRREVRDILRRVEEAYWRLVQARREIVVTARLLADFESIYDYLDSRRDFDIMPVQLAATRANLEQSKADFIQLRAAVFDAEDRLIALLNDPQLNLADDVEIVPTDFPQLTPVVVDRLTECQAALNHRAEIQEQQLRISSAKLLVQRTKNEELPQFDVTFRQTYDGLGTNADLAFDQLTQGNFIEYFIGVEFQVPIGNRARRAAKVRAMLQHRQAMAQLKATFEDVLLDVNQAVRRMSSSYDQIAPSLESAQAREREVNSIVARAERKDFNTLNSELAARQNLSASRRAMLAAAVDYNIALIDLERARGTLLEYYNVVIPEEGERADSVSSVEP